MVKVGFIVEGDTEKIVIESALFQTWASQQGVEICKPVLDAKGGGNLLPQNIEPLIERLRCSKPDHIVILTDLEHDPDMEAVRKRIGDKHTKLVFIAVKAIEAWFLADSSALGKWLGISVSEIWPEKTKGMPWERLKELAAELNLRGPGASKPAFAKKITKKCGFSISNAAQHPNCPSAKLFHDGLTHLSNP